MNKPYDTVIDFRADRDFLPSTIRLSSDTNDTVIHRLLQKNRMIYKIKSVFPFDFFPDELVIDENKISVYTRDFYFSNDVRCFLYKDIQYVEVFSSVLFASIHIKVFGFPHDDVQISYLKKDVAYKARRLIQGLMESARENIDFSTYSMKSMTANIEKLGTAHGGEL